MSAAAAKSLRSCPTLRDPINGSPPGSPVSGILQARTLEWVGISFSKKMKIGTIQKPEMWETCVQSLCWEDPLEKGMATYCSILPWRIPWTV